MLICRKEKRKHHHFLIRWYQYLHTHTHELAHSEANKILSGFCYMTSNWIRPMREKSQRWWAYIHKYWEYEYNRNDISCVFRLVLPFNSLHHVAHFEWQTFRKHHFEMWSPCVWCGICRVSYWFGMAYSMSQFHIHMYIVYGKCQRTIYFILHKRKIKLSFIRNGEQYATSYSTDENEANVEIEYAYSVWLLCRVIFVL